MKMLLFKILIILSMLGFAALGYIFSMDIARIISKFNPVYFLPLVIAILIVLSGILIAMRRKKL